MLTAAHCVMPGATYKLVEFDAARQPILRDTARVVQHPQFDLNTMLGHRATADVALIKLAEPLPAVICAAPLGAGAHASRSATASSSPATASPCAATAAPAARCAPPRWSPPASPARCRFVWSIPPRSDERAGPRRLHRRFAARPHSTDERPPRRDRRRELVDRAETHRRLRRPHRRHAAGALPRLDRRDRTRQMGSALP